MPEVRVIFDVGDVTAFLVSCKNKGQDGEECGHEVRLLADELQSVERCSKCEERLVSNNPNGNNQAPFFFAFHLLNALKDLANDALPLRIRFETTAGTIQLPATLRQIE